MCIDYLNNENNVTLNITHFFFISVSLDSSLLWDGCMKSWLSWVWPAGFGAPGWEKIGFGGGWLAGFSFDNPRAWAFCFLKSSMVPRTWIFLRFLSLPIFLELCFNKWSVFPFFSKIWKMMMKMD